MVSPLLSQLGIVAAYAILARRGKFTYGQHALTMFWLAFAYVGFLLQTLDPRLIYLYVFGFLGCIARMYWLLFERTRNTESPRSQLDNCSLGVFMGSGGHTAEMKALLSTLDFERYTPRRYVYCYGDEMSLRVIEEVEASRRPIATAATPVRSHTLLALPRARQVGESRISTLLSASKTLFAALWHTFLLPLLRHPKVPWVDVLLINGPGTAVILVAVAWIRRFFGLRWTKIIYVESFARTNSLSLSGRMLRGYVDVFVVQWPEAAGRGSTKPFLERDAALGEVDQHPKVVHRGWLV